MAKSILSLKLYKKKELTHKSKRSILRPVTAAPLWGRADKDEEESHEARAIEDRSAPNPAGTIQARPEEPAHPEGREVPLRCARRP